MNAMVTSREPAPPKWVHSITTHLEISCSRHDDFPQPWNSESNVGTTVAGQMERVQRHLRGWLSDGLRRDRPYRLPRCSQAPHVLDPHQQLERLFPLSG